jgi:hypothetical protein
MVLGDESVIVIADGSFIIIGFLFIYDERVYSLENEINISPVAERAKQ